MSYLDSLDVANRALQLIGALPINSITEDSNNNTVMSFAYDKVRRAELRRNVWRFATREAILRPVDTTTMLLDPVVFDPAITYLQGTIVKDANGLFWISQIAANLGNTPGGNNEGWDMYFGPISISLYDSTVTYQSGELVYKETGSPGGYAVYLSLQSDNTDNPSTATAWLSTFIYNRDDVVTNAGTMWRSIVEVNHGITPVEGAFWTALPPIPTSSIKWRAINAQVKNLLFMYPIGAGPASQDATRNVYRMPAGYLREAPQDPKAGAISYLGAPWGMPINDWLFEGNYIITRDAGPLRLRFVADVTRVTQFDDMFCEGLACRIATATCEQLTQSTSKLGSLASQYKLFMTEARLVNGIETGPTEPPLDDYIMARA